MRYFLGLDLGQAADPTALAVLERIPLPRAPNPEVDRFLGPPLGEVDVHWHPPAQPRSLCHYQCGHLERLRLGTSYPAVADHVARLLNTDALKNQTRLVVDGTGVGRPVVDMLSERGLNPLAVTITGGDTVTFEKGWRVPKRDLVGAVQVLLQTDRLKFSEQIPAVSTLVQELLAFRVKIDPLTAHDSYGAAWREGAHDDMVLAVAIAAWWGERSPVNDGQKFRTIRARM